TSREQESGELKSRVKDLEDLKNKNERLISLQNSELAELREKLQALQDAKAAAPAATAPATAPAASVTPPRTPPPRTPPPAAAPPAAAPAAPAASAPITKDDIWGNGEKAATST